MARNSCDNHEDEEKSTRTNEVKTKCEVCGKYWFAQDIFKKQLQKHEKKMIKKSETDHEKPKLIPSLKKMDLLHYMLNFYVAALISLLCKLVIV